MSDDFFCRVNISGKMFYNLEVFSVSRFLFGVLGVVEWIGIVLSDRYML